MLERRLWCVRWNRKERTPVLHRRPTPASPRASTCSSASGRRPRVVLLPTDTVYGLAVLPTEEEAVNRLYALKGRPRMRNLPIIIPDADQLDRLGVEPNDRVSRLLSSPHMPGSLTLIASLIRSNELPDCGLFYYIQNSHSCSSGVVGEVIMKATSLIFLASMVAAISASAPAGDLRLISKGLDNASSGKKMHMVTIHPCLQSQH
jgi:hypothetical protein